LAGFAETFVEKSKISRRKIRKRDGDITNRENYEKTKDFHTCKKYGVLDGSLTILMTFFKICKASQKSKSGFEEHF